MDEIVTFSIEGEDYFCLAWKSEDGSYFGAIHPEDDPDPCWFSSVNYSKPTEVIVFLKFVKEWTENGIPLNAIPGIF